MGRVLTRDVALAFAIEQSLGVLPAQPAWTVLEPNAPSAFGNTTSTTARTPITKDRQRRQGSTTDLDSSPEFEADLTLSHLRQFIEGFVYSRAVGAPVLVPSAAASGSFTVPAVAASEAALFTYGASAAKSLVHARGFANLDNNGVFVLDGAVATNATSISVEAGGATETAPTDREVQLSLCGVRGATGDLEINGDGNLISSALDFTTLGLTPGQVIHVGGVDANNNFANAANTGLARVVSIASNIIVLDRKSSVFVADNGDGVEIDILFGQFVRNVSSDHPDYLERSFQFEMSAPGLGGGGQTQYEYALGNMANQITITIPLTDKATVSMGFVGQFTTDPAPSRAANAASAILPTKTEAFGTADDIGRLFLQDVDENGLTTDFKSVTVTLTNNASGEKVLGVLGPKYINTGNIEVDVDLEMLFTDPAVVSAIRLNEETGFGFTLRNGDGGVAFDFPAGTLDGGDRDYALNESLKISSTFMSHRDQNLGTSLGVSFFPVLPVS